MVILNHIGIIIKNALIVRIVAGNLHVPRVVIGSNSTWELAEKRRTYTSRKKVMSKKKRSQALSDSDENNYGNTSPHGPAARGKTHKGGNSLGTCTQGSTSPPVTGQLTTGQTTTNHSPNGREDITDQPRIMPGQRA